MWFVVIYQTGMRIALSTLHVKNGECDDRTKTYLRTSRHDDNNMTHLRVNRPNVLLQQPT